MTPKITIKICGYMRRSDITKTGIKRNITNCLNTRLTPPLKLSAITITEFTDHHTEFELTVTGPREKLYEGFLQSFAGNFESESNTVDGVPIRQFIKLLNAPTN